MPDPQLATLAKHCRRMAKRPTKCPCGLRWSACAIHLWDGDPPTDRERWLWLQLAEEIDAYLAGDLEQSPDDPNQFALIADVPTPSDEGDPR